MVANYRNRKLRAGDITEDRFLGVYGLFSHNFQGSEGGLNISFTKTTRKNWWSSTEEYYKTEEIYRVENVTVTGSLRHIESEQAREIVESLKDFLYKIRDRMNPQMASFVVRYGDWYYNMGIVNGKVRSNKVKMFY